MTSGKSKANYNRLRRERVKSFILDYLRTHPCIACGESDPVVLEFDHREPSSKLWSVCEAVRLRVSILTLEREISKCDVLCANCHRRKTARDFGYYSHLDK